MDYTGTDDRDRSKEELLVQLETLKHEIHTKELALTSSEAKYRYLVESINDVIYEITNEGVIKYLSPSMVMITGYTPEELTGTNVFRIVYPDDTAAILDRLASKDKTAPSFIDFRFICKNGEVRWVRSLPSKVFLNGEVVGRIGILTDITQQKKYELEILKSEEKFRTIFENVQDVYYEISMDGTILEISPSVAIFTDRQYLRDDLIGRSIFDFYIKIADRNTHLAALRKFGNVINCELTFQNRDGSPLYCVYNARLIYNSGGVPLKVIGSIHDITKRKLAEEKLRKLSSAVEQSPVSILITNPDGTIEYANPKACQTTGYSYDELMGKNPRVLKSGETQPADYDLLWNNIRSGKEWRGTFHNKRKDGELYWESSVITPILDKDGQTTHYLAIKQDITERRKTEDELLRFRTITDRASYGSAITTVKGDILYVNEAFAQMHGMESRNLIGQNLSVFHTEEQSIHVGQLIEQLFARGSFSSEEVWHVKQDGTPFPTLMNATIIYDENGVPLYFSATAIDITGRKKSEEALISSEAALNQAQEISKTCSWELNLKTNELYWSKNYYQMMGVPIGSEMKGEYFLSQVHPEDLHMVEENFEVIRNTGNPVTYVLRLRMINGEYKWIENNIVPVFDADELIALQGVNLDVTEKKKAEEKIKYQNERLNAIIHAIPDLIFVIDKEGKYLEVFASDSEKLLVAREKIINTNISDVFDQEMTRLFLTKINEVLNQNEIKIVNYKVSLPDSPSTHFEARIVRLDNDKALILARDITLQSKKESEIRKLSLAVEQSPVSIVITDLSANIEYVNPAFEATTGYTREEVLGQNTNILKSGKTDISMYNNLWENLGAGKEWHGEWINKKKNGELYWENILITPIHDDKGTLMNYLAVKQDITERKQIESKIRDLNSNLEIKIRERTALLEKTNEILLKEIEVRKQTEQALAHSEESYRSVVENVNEVIFRTDANGLWLFLNKSWEEITGFSVRESLGQFFVNYVHPDDRARNRELFEPLINRRKEYCRHEIRYLTKEGSFRWVEVYARPGLDKNGEIIGTYGTLNDITERKSAEEALTQMSARLTLALRVGRIGVWDYDIVNNVLFWDNQMFEMYRVKEGDFSNVYDTWLKCLHPEDREKSDHEIRMAISGEKEFDTEFRVVWPDGSIRYINALGAVQHSDSGQPLHMVGINWDTTIQKRAADFENELLQLSPMLTGISHSGINSALELTLARIGQFLTADRAYIFEFDAAKATMSNTFEWRNQGITSEIEHIKGIPSSTFPMWMQVLQKHENIIIPSVKELPASWKAEHDMLDLHGIKSMVAIPMLADNDLIGFVGLDSVTEKKEINPAEINILTVWSSMLASLISKQRTESLLELTRQNFETFFNTIDDFLWVLDQKGNIIHTNNTVRNRLEYSVSELLNVSVLAVHPVERREEAARIVGEMLAGTTEFCPVPIVSKSGRMIPVETRVKPGYWNGVPVIFGVSKDISKIQLSEQKFSSAFHSNSAMMTIATISDGRFLDVNNAFVELMGYSREEILGKNGEALGIFVDQYMNARIAGALNQNLPIRKMEVLLRTREGQSLNGLMSAEPIYIGDVRCLLTVIIDITERIKAEEEIRKARDEAEHANMAKSEFLSRMSHELRTPMNSILGFAQLLEMGQLSPVQKKGVRHIMKSGRHLLDLINEVLDISRIEAGRLSLSIEPIRLMEIIQEMRDILKPYAMERQVTFQLVCSSEEELFVKSDRQRLSQVMLNLINNAIKYNKPGGFVEIRTDVKPQNSNGIVPVRISISDTGLGISPTDLPKLFNPFERIGAERSGTEGTGLGLAVVKKLIDAMGGNLGVESVPEEGSTFWIELPYCESPLKGAEESVRLAKPETDMAVRSGTILYIEDNASNLELLEHILTSQRPHINLISCVYGEYAVDLAIRHNPDLILLDLNLPDLHGSEVIKLLQANDHTNVIPVVIISADAMPLQINRLIAAGAKNYLTKPLDVPDLLKIIDLYVSG